MHGPRRGRRRGGPVDAGASLGREWRREEVPSTSSSRFAHASSPGLSRGTVETVVSPGARGGRRPSAAPTTVGGRAHLPRRRKTLKEERNITEKLDFFLLNSILPQVHADWVGPDGAVGSGRRCRRRCRCRRGCRRRRRHCGSHITEEGALQLRCVGLAGTWNKINAEYCIIVVGKKIFTFEASSSPW